MRVRAFLQYFCNLTIFFVRSSSRVVQCIIFSDFLGGFQIEYWRKESKELRWLSELRKNYYEFHVFVRFLTLLQSFKQIIVNNNYESAKVINWQRTKETAKESAPSKSLKTNFGNILKCQTEIPSEYWTYSLILKIYCIFKLLSHCYFVYIWNSVRNI